MLKELIIENIAVIENAHISFDNGFNVLTGETGAGKSIVIDSINAVLGERTSKELIRTGAESARVVASFTDIGDNVRLRLEESGLVPNDDDTLLISRSISLSGKNSCKINGLPVSVTQLKEIGNELVNIHGQHDSQSLMQPEKHCGFIDAMADNEELRNEYKSAFHELIRVKKELDALYDSRDEIATRLDYLNFAVEEISSADIHIGEIDELNKEKSLLQNSKKVVRLLEESYLSINSDNGLSDSLKECASKLEDASKYYEEGKPVSERIRSISYELDDCTASIRSLLDHFDFSPSRITEIDDRLDRIYQLSVKYGKNEEEILKFYENALIEKDSFENADGNIEKLEKELFALSDNVKLLSSRLTESRRTTALAFEKNVKEQLEFLDMPNVRFVVDIQSSKLTSRGADNIEFLISVNPGQDPKPIAKTASGGELSRIMLAIKNVLLDKDPVSTLIFDEIDTGVSGSAADKIARKLYSVSKGRQVICVTHLARIAAQADTQMKIEKRFTDDNTYTEVTKLDMEGRAVEIARITSGTSVTSLQIESAKEMLINCKEN